MDTNYIIETKNLTKQYGSQKSVADLNIHVKRGRIYGLLGRNGAGKTTTMKMLLGLTKPTSGEVKIWGKPLQGNEKKLLPRIGSLIESPGFYPNLTGTENLRIFATLRGVPNNHAIKDALDLVGLPYKDKKLFSQYSLGMKQRLAIALAVMHDPELLILDEPINGLDPIGIAEVRSFIRELCDTRGKTILISSHILSEISLLADDIGIIAVSYTHLFPKEAELNEKMERLSELNALLNMDEKGNETIMADEDIGREGSSTDSRDAVEEKELPETADRIHKPSILERLKQEKAQQNTAEQSPVQKAAKKKHEQEL